MTFCFSIVQNKSYGLLSNSLPKAGREIVLSPGIDHPRDPLRVLAEVEGVATTRSVALQAPAKVGTVPTICPIAGDDPMMGMGGRCVLYCASFGVFSHHEGCS